MLNRLLNLPGERRRSGGGAGRLSGLQAETLETWKRRQHGLLDFPHAAHACLDQERSASASGDNVDILPCTLHATLTRRGPHLVLQLARLRIGDPQDCGSLLTSAPLAIGVPSVPSIWAPVLGAAIGARH